MEQAAIEKLFVEKFNKFTKPQQAIITRFLAGDKLTTINNHHLSGGEWRWVRSSSTYLEYAGHISKASSGIYWTLKKLVGVEVNFMKYYFVR